MANFEWCRSARGPTLWSLRAPCEREPLLAQGGVGRETFVSGVGLVFDSGVALELDMRGEITEKQVRQQVRQQVGEGHRLEVWLHGVGRKLEWAVCHAWLRGHPRSLHSLSPFLLCLPLPARCRPLKLPCLNGIRAFRGV
jgi:hypothetical protein